MVAIYAAYTQQINPAGATPVLTRPQVWAGLQRKIRRAQDFVPVIHDCDVIEEKDNVVVREAHFTTDGVPGRGGKTIREVCKSYEPIKVDFHQPDGALISNVISDGPSMTDHDLNIAYIFEWLHHDVEAGSAQHMKLVEEHRKGAKMAVDMSIQAMRRMAAAGEL